MQKLLVAFISVVTLMGIVAPSPAYAIQERNADRLARGLPPLPPTRRDSAKYPHPSHPYKDHDDDHGKGDDEHKGDEQGHNHYQRNSDRLARGLPPLPPPRRHSAGYSAKRPRPSHPFKDDHGKGDDEHKDDLQGHSHQGRNSDRLARGLPPLPPPRRDSGDSAKRPRPSHPFKDDHGKGDDEHKDDLQGHNHQERNSDRLARGLPPLPPTRRDSAGDSAKRPRPSHPFKDDHGKGDDEHKDDQQGHHQQNSDRHARGRPPPPPTPTHTDTASPNSPRQSHHSQDNR